MDERLPIPRIGDVFEDVRGEDRTMRISLHRDRAGDSTTVVVSLWVGPLCRGSFRMAPDDLDRLVSALGEMKAALPPAAPAGQAPAGRPPASGAAGGCAWVPGWFGFGVPAALAGPDAAAAGTAEPPAPTPRAA